MKEEAKLTFFHKYSDFDYNPRVPVSAEFKRLGRLRKWSPGSKTWRKKWNACMGEMYDISIGNRICSLETWQKMCEKVGIEGAYTSIRQCRQVRL